MSLAEQMAKLNEIELSEIDFSNAGLWPRSAKIACLVLLSTVVLMAGYYWVVNPSLQKLSDAKKREQTLKKTFESRAHQAANIDGFREQNRDLTVRFDQLLKQLPSQTEVPGLIEDITIVGVNGGLRIEKINLKKETEQEFFVELPMSIQLRGSYHNFGAFVSGVSSLSRIVTLHDYNIKGATDGQLSMVIEAKTYRYRD